MIYITLCHEGKLQISSTQKEGTEVESANPGQPLLVQPQSETETNTIAGGSDVTSRVSHQHCSSGNLLAQVCLPVGTWGKTEWGKEERKGLFTLLDLSSAGFMKNSLPALDVHIYCHPLPCWGKTLLDLWDLSKFLRHAEQIKPCRDGLGKEKM